MTDPIADMLTRIRNAIMASRSLVVMPHSKMKEAIAKILQDNGFIASYKVEANGIFKSLVITVRPEDDAPAITALQRVSKPGRRVYTSAGDIPLVLGGRGMVIVSTSGGVMSGREARAKGLGGELICKVW
jgi:small subunit ribosomal protein S8